MFGDGICRYNKKPIIKTKDNTCNICENYKDLNIHLITPRYGTRMGNMLLLCKECSDLASYYWKTNCRDWDEGKHPDDLYKLIKEK